MHEGYIERVPNEGDSNRTLTQIVYILQACSLLVGVTAIVAVIINYVKLDDVRGTRWESHFHWQIRTFWWALAGYVISGPLFFLFGLGAVLAFAVWVWSIYRVVKGYLALNDGKQLP
ncbi:DUF4870 family protein [Vogesella oryzae]|uniref:DUF4870 family protein n=1 Tax=Vogesella oryzae TaxID=1735285 RepID=UPI0015837B9E|nr:hypothetical protein [Vogesella oryzae]